MTTFQQPFGTGDAPNGGDYKGVGDSRIWEIGRGSKKMTQELTETVEIEYDTPELTSIAASDLRPECFVHVYIDSDFYVTDILANVKDYPKVCKVMTSYRPTLIDFDN